MINACDIKYGCRKNLVKYTFKILESVNIGQSSKIIDLGCGTGVTALTLAKHFNSVVYCVDTNLESLSWLIANAKESHLSNKIITFHKSALEMDFQNSYFDLTIAEGIFNIIGFEKGLEIAGNLTKSGGHIIIHDDYAEHAFFLELVNKFKLKLLNSLIINEKEWWELYFKPLYGKILPFKNSPFEKDLENEFNEIESFLENPLAFRSIYYILKK